MDDANKLLTDALVLLGEVDDDQYVELRRRIRTFLAQHPVPPPTPMEKKDAEKLLGELIQEIDP